MKEEHFIVKPGKSVNIKDFNQKFTGSFADKSEAEKKLSADIELLARYQELLYAEAKHAVLMIVQAMDAAGKDSVIKHVMSGVNPQGCRVVSFKEPSAEELRHDYLWRCERELPPRGFIGIFNRSYYEEVLTVRVHPELLMKQNLPGAPRGETIWKERFEDINCFERHLVRNGIVVVKFFLNVSKAEQKKRFLARLDESEKHWKFSPHDVEERRYWKQYMNVYEEMLSNTSTPWAPWHVIPADHKWFTRVAVADILVRSLKNLKCSYPTISEAVKRQLDQAKKTLMTEK